MKAGEIRKRKGEEKHEEKDKKENCMQKNL
jgi:hypothetical protein